VQRFVSSRALAIVAVSLISLVGGALLAWWQWTRYTSATGTLQNLGYVLQWPLFGVFPGFMFWRIHRGTQHEWALDAETEQPAEFDTPKKPEAPSKVDPRLTYVQNRTVTYVAEEDQELLAYNHRLARLADQEQHHAG
jgi:DNA-binding transcriptional regulator of glucitol operon